MCFTYDAAAHKPVDTEVSTNFTYRVSHVDDRAGMETIDAMETHRTFTRDYKEGRGRRAGLVLVPHAPPRLRGGPGVGRGGV